MRKSFAEQIKDYAPDVRDVNDKDAILNLLGSAMDDAEAQLRGAADEKHHDSFRRQADD
jgi:hypothetical protein